MGQGITTGLATIVAEEMDADWSQMRVELAPADPDRFDEHSTTASSSLAKSWAPLRHMGAAARHMLVGAASEKWGVDPSELEVANGLVRLPSRGLEASFGDLAPLVRTMNIPRANQLRLKSPSEWNLIGQSLPRVDALEKTDGTATYGMDIRRPGMVRAVVARPPRFGAKLVGYNPQTALSVPGVLEVVEIPNAVAVIAANTWAAMQGRDSLQVSWDEADSETRSTEEIFSEYRALANAPGRPALRRGDPDPAFQNSYLVHEFEYEFPYLAHAAMEPLNAVIEKTDGGARIWAGSQLQQDDQVIAAQVLGLDDPKKVELNTVLCGSSFGRRADSLSQWIEELAHIARASLLDRPIHLVWTREDDMRGGQYRPMALHRGRVGIDKRGAILGWSHSAVCKSIVEGTPWSRSMGKTKIDRAAVGGLIETSYAIPNFWVDWNRVDSPVPVAFWRSVGDSQTGFVMETVIDELAFLADRDPIEYRMDLLAKDERQRRVLEIVAEKSQWGRPLRHGRGRGVATTFDDILQVWPRTYIAMVAEVSVTGGNFAVEKIIAALDCGTVVNPDIVVSQVEGSVAFAMSTVTRNEITLRDGAVVQSNFHDYEPTRMSEMPEVEVYLVESVEAPSGIGEVAVAPVAPAVANALHKATGKRLRRLPLKFEV